MPERLVRKRDRGFRLPPGAVYVGRPSRWGNPYALSLYQRDYPDATDRDQREMAKSDYRNLISGRFDGLADTPEHVTHDEIRAELRGKSLVCWCPVGMPCHADVLLEVANA